MKNLYSKGSIRLLHKKSAKSFKAKFLPKVFSEDYSADNKKIYDPRGTIIRRWNKIFLAACIVSLFVDPLYFYLPFVTSEMCIDIASALEVFVTILRTSADIFYMIHIYICFRTAYVAPSSRVFGRGELVVDEKLIALRYLKRSFWIDLVTAFPLPQVLILIIIPSLHGSSVSNTRNMLLLFIIFQYIPRLFFVFPLSSKIVNSSGVVTVTAWQGAAYNLILFMLASHVLGACWYLLSIERQEGCWRSVCDLEKPNCWHEFLDCKRVSIPYRSKWFTKSNITNACNPHESTYPFGIYANAMMFNITSLPFFSKYFYCLWWGLNTLSSLGQNLSTTVYEGEILFAIIIATVGLVLFALLIGNMQMYLQSTTVRLEEWRIKRRDTEQWMHHRHLPPDLRQAIRKYFQFKWVATRGVDEEDLLHGLPLDLRRDIKRHLCLDLVRRVPLFDQMDERTLDAICERLKPELCTGGTFLVREGDPVNEIFFVIRGYLDSYTTNGGRTGFFNSCRIGPGDFCGEELLTWALDPQPSIVLPSSTRSVKSVSEVEAFALRADDLKFVASQFRRLHSKQLRQRFRFYSQQWRTWASCFIQSAWRRHKKRQHLARANDKTSSTLEYDLMGHGSSVSNAAQVRRGVTRHADVAAGTLASLQKPSDPDFSVDED